MAVFDRMLVAALNHVLQHESWARERLRPYAGAQALVQAGPLDIHLAITADGLFGAGSPAAVPAVTITLPHDTPFKLLQDRKAAFQAARLSGSADLAETLAFVFRNLRWDVEADLARYLGDIPAHRLEGLRKALLTQGRQATQRLFGNLAEYAAEDSTWLASRHEIEAFGRDVEVLRDDLARLENRLARL